MLTPNLGLALRSRGELNEAIDDMRKARELAKTNPRMVQRIERVLAATERQASLSLRLPAVLAGKLTPAVPPKRSASPSSATPGAPRASARFWSEAFQAQPKLADDMQVQNRYNAACAAALAGCGQGKDDPPLDEAAKTHWRNRRMAQGRPGGVGEESRIRTAAGATGVPRRSSTGKRHRPGRTSRRRRRWPSCRRRSGKPARHSGPRSIGC